MPEIDIKYIHQKITTNNYLSNCYRNLTRSKIIHFIFILIESILNILNILNIILNDYTRNTTSFTYIAPLAFLFKHFSETTKLIIVIFLILIFDSIHIILCIKDCKKKKMYNKILINYLELFHFRVLLLPMFHLFFSLNDNYFLIGLIFVVIHVYLTIYNFLYSHLYYFVPIFMEYPYDAFSSLYDLILVYYKIMSSLSYYSINNNIGKFYFIVLLISKIFFCVYFYEKSTNHSYLLMKNTFINKAKLSSIWFETIIMIAALIVGKTEIQSMFFFLVIICIFVIIVVYILLLYNPYNFIHIETETPNENLYFYFYILSNQNSLDFLFEAKIRQHFDKCGHCLICKKFVNYLVKNHRLSEEEEKMYLNFDSNINEDNTETTECINKNQLKDLFDVIYDGNNKYFYLIKQISDNYKIKSKQFLNNNIEYYFINLSFLIYTDYTKYNINLSLNEKIILEEISKYLENFDHQMKITQLLLCNKYITTCKEVFNKIREILNSEQNIAKAKKLIDLSFLLTELKDKKYRYNLFSTKFENITNAKNLILICSIVFEEIFNTALSNTQVPIRNNPQILEDVFVNNLGKHDKKISLALTLNKKECKIIRAGKGLSSFLNENLFDLFPIEFKQYQIDLFTQSILNNFNYNIVEKEKEKDKLKDISYSLGYSSLTQIKKRASNISRIATSSSKLLSINPHKNKPAARKEYIKIEIIICQNIFSRIYYQLVTLKLTPLFNTENNYFILLDGVNFVHKHTIITMVDHEQNYFAEETIFSISEPRLEFETEVVPISLKKYKKWLYDQGFITSKVFSFNIYSKIYYIYMVLSRNKDFKRKMDKNMSFIGETKIIDIDEIEREKSLVKNSNKEKINYKEDNASFFSQQLLNSIDKGMMNVGFKNKKIDESYNHSGFNKIRKIAYLIIAINIILILIEYIHLISVENDIESSNDTFHNFREFYKLYYQLFSMTLSIVCIDEDSSKCNNVISFYTDQFFEKHPDIKFDIISFLNIQNYRLSLKLMEKRSIFNNIYKYIGEIKYNEIFRKYITYLRINKTFDNEEIKYDILENEEIFSELLLITCNNFKFITETDYTQTIIHLLNGVVNPFSNFNVSEIHEETESNVYQQYIYELIINYKTFSMEIENINENLKQMLDKKYKNLKIYIYIYLNLNLIVIIIIEIVIFIYIGYFEKILIIILNIINMTLNNKIDDFKFNEMFSKKIDNLENIINLYIESPKESLQNLSDIYNNYQTFLINKKKKEAREAEKRGYRMKYEQKIKMTETEEVPKSQRILNKNNVRQLRILTKYLITYLILILIALCIYIFTMLFWDGYFTKQKYLNNLLLKNNNLETAIYRAINLYYMMVFNNLTSNFATEILYPSIYNESESLTIFKYFYSTLKYGFNNKIEIDNLGNLYKNFSNLESFTCGALYQDEAKDLINLYNSDINPNDDVQKKLTNMCIYFVGMDSDKSLYLIENHFQYIKNGIINLDDFSYEGIISHLREGALGRISLFFNIIMTFLINIVYYKRHTIAIQRIIKMLESYIQITGFVFVLYDIVLTVIIIFFFIRRIKKYCNQILLLKNTFQITKMEL